MKPKQANHTLCETHSVGGNTREWIITPHRVPELKNFQIPLTGWSEAREGFVFVRMRSPIGQILVCAEGRGEVWINGEWVPCERGMAYITPCDVLHAYRAVPDTVWMVYWVTYHAGVVTEKEPVLRATDPQPLVSALRHLYDEATGVADPTTRNHWANLVHTAAQRILHPAPYDPRLQRLWRIVQEKPGYPWDNRQLAAEVGISNEHLRRLCQKAVGCSPMDYVTQLRMQHAAALLATRAYPIATVAQRVGYSNPFSFSTAFKRVQGVAPSHYAAARVTSATSEVTS